ncbi:SDR family oxidoreductase [Candidatus Protochlamydia amoebophila]|uniref:NADP-dependent L-serine/L-allo-threonine dehydrogenase YdfG n=2 Tax=Candidatus Protochlamydia TaxID=282132 RepID=A0A0C1HAI6_9BACT|nr:SDR family oxidoreductase [Candidatus Protochlamydia amoebophila]KIC71843.1 NADP-dependent L-serine/L-allo-threonine dehydrogenase YdfG [Candidatus Protochlamydia amoebophila]
MGGVKLPPYLRKLQERALMGQLFINSTVMITGASSGFGAETARLFAKEGARLILLARRKDRLVELQNELKEKFQTKSYCITADIGNFELLEEQISNLDKNFERPNILINNAGMVKGLDKLWEVKPQDWNTMIDTNIKGVLNATRLIVPSMLKADQGHIINVGSTSGHGIYSGGGVYCATKFALRALTDTLRTELISTSIRVSLISPGIAKTEFSLVRFAGDKQKADKVYEGLEALNATDIAEAILFIASRPAHVNIADMVIYPKSQASSSIIHRA